jgi:pimeloyl-ACP methyl ester carboxylesterase
MRGFEPFADDMALELVPDAGHFLAEERPEFVAERVRAFFAE